MTPVPGDERLVPPVSDEFVSDAWNSLDPKPTPGEIAELWVDQMAPIGTPKNKLDDAIRAATMEVRYYLP